MTKKLTTQEFNNRLQEKYPDIYIVVGSYINSSTPIDIVHRKCGRHIHPRPNDLFSRYYTCNECRKDILNSELSNSSFNNKISSLSGGNLSLIGDYTGYRNTVRLHCKKHNVDFTTLPVNATRRERVTCPKCVSEKKRKSQVKSEEVFLNELHDSHNGTIVAEDKYVNTHTKIQFKCTVCNNTFRAEPNSVTRISGCPYCKQYKGENIIADYLDSLDILFEPQKKFTDLKDNRNLSYDFYLPDYNILIEYNGEQHYKPIDFFGGIPSFNKQLLHDRLKSEYADNNGYNLLSIRYTNKSDDIISQIDSVLVR